MIWFYALPPNNGECFCLVCRPPKSLSSSPYCFSLFLTVSHTSVLKKETSSFFFVSTSSSSNSSFVSSSPHLFPPSRSPDRRDWRERRLKRRHLMPLFSLARIRPEYTPWGRRRLKKTIIPAPSPKHASILSPLPPGAFVLLPHISYEAAQKNTEAPPRSSSMRSCNVWQKYSFLLLLVFSLALRPPHATSDSEVRLRPSARSQNRFLGSVWIDNWEDEGGGGGGKRAKRRGGKSETAFFFAEAAAAPLLLVRPKLLF